MRFAIFFTLVSLSKPTASSQSTWVWQNPLPQGNPLNGVVMVDQTTFVCVGDAGTIVKTTDLGASWDCRHFVGGRDVTLNGVSFSGLENGIVVGGSGVIHRTTDGGGTWLTHQEDSLITLRGVCHLDGQNVIVVGDAGTILRSSDGGIQWSAEVSGTVQNLFGVGFADTNSGFASGDVGTILATTDGGRTWEDRSYAWEVTFFAVSSPQTGVATAVGETGAIIRTRDGGMDWELQHASTNIDLKSVCFSDTSNGSIAGGGTLPAPSIFRTTNGGRGWTPTPPDTDFTRISCLSFREALSGVAVGSTSIFVTSDMGFEWTDLSQMVTTSGEGLTTVSLSDADHGMISRGLHNGRDGLLRTTNGGRTWGGPPLPDINSVSMPSVKVAMAVGDVGYDGYNVYRTTDGGDTWTGGQAGGRIGLDAVSFSNENCGAVIGNFPHVVILTTLDGGETWTQGTLGTTDRLYGLSMSDPYHGYAVGDTGTILFTSDGGASWIGQPAGTSLFVRAVSAPNERNATVVGHNGLILRTTNEGQTWAQQSSETTDDLWGVSFPDSAYGMAVGGPGIVLRTTDAGNTWSQCPKVTNLGLAGVSYVDRNTATVIGVNGIIIRTTTGGVTWTQEDRWTKTLPQQLVLEQNYPNPFNPSTTIRYGLPHASFVTLTVYNTLGQQVARLVGGQQQAGYHEVVFRHDGLASGVYFYRLEAENSASVKKLILLK